MLSSHDEIIENASSMVHKMAQTLRRPHTVLIILLTHQLSFLNVHKLKNQVGTLTPARQHSTECTCRPGFSAEDTILPKAWLLPSVGVETLGTNTCSRPQGLGYRSRWFGILTFIPSNF